MSLLQRSSLDAPVVAMLWCALLMRIRGGEGWLPLIALGFAVWLVYLIDHWLDGDTAAALLVGPAMAGGVLAVSLLPAGLVIRGVLLAGAVPAYLGAVHIGIKE